MFYAQIFTSKRSTLAKIWLAAHWEKKITKAHVFECDLETTIQEILSPQIKIGLRTSGHLLLGVVRIYSRKTKYLLADCNDALIKIKVAFRPGQTDLPEDAMEATLKTITLPEDFTDFDSQLPDLNTIGVADHFSLNQCRTEDITLKESFENHFLTLERIGEEIQSYQGLFDQSFSVHGDCFGDEEMAVDLIDIIANTNDDAVVPDFYEDTPNELPATPPPTAVTAAEPESVKPELSCLKDRSSPALTETTFLVNAEEGFALAPVAATPSSTRKRGTRKRKLVIDRSKELTNSDIRNQLADCSDLVTPLEIAPPTRQLMEWRENGGVRELFSSFCLPLLHPDLKQLFPSGTSSRRLGLEGGAREQTDPEEMREQPREEVWESTAQLVLDDWSVLQESVGPDQPAGADTTVEASVTHSEPPPPWNTTSEESGLEVSYPEPLSEISMLPNPSGEMRETPLTQTQSVVNTQDAEDKRMTSRAHNLLQALKRQDSSPNAEYSLHALCESSSRSFVAAVFFCLLVLRKQQILNLHQSAPYSDIIATPGPLFSSF
ncbi:double-strand-break repair protein rad21-like protein 1 [Labeo rohita]|uniref:double-strand-break repair protein rad21-like protein 1 n=1 Tax=Labeo rohita TaxID=84645 RepID=UPI0021E28382|nr:double-strand-break repair protein rad21-like protein 1 [Labeo rohita]XP_050972501.1 double-strand-break repair protein rad21-like protein 1 [Labeo rohita]XP_050972502.1 double-strand-break repair protein rad21-like protein 1 [Labeo rohita]